MGKEHDTILTGASGQYFVAAELSRQGYVACITLGNTRGIDILASNPVAMNSVAIQVKTCWGEQARWRMNKKAEADLGENLYYVFVRLPESGPPAYHIVSGHDVATYVHDSHREALAKTGRGGRPPLDSDMRVFKDAEDKYLNRWDRLRLGPPTPAQP